MPGSSLGSFGSSRDPSELARFSLAVGERREGCCFGSHDAELRERLRRARGPSFLRGQGVCTLQASFKNIHDSGGKTQPDFISSLD